MFDRRVCRDHRGHHPWRFLGQFPEWRVQFVNHLPPDKQALTIFAEKRILVADRQTTAERRSAICHEGSHVLRGPFPSWRTMYEEALCDRQASRLLLPSVRRVGHAISWHRADHEKAADDLWVDDKLLNVRLSTLAPAERAWLREQLATVLI